MSLLNRRQFITLGASSAGAVFLSQCWNGQAQNASKRIEGISPQRFTSSGGLLEVDLEASVRSVKLGSQQANVLTYNGQVPGPRLEAKPGDTVRIRFTNQLPQPTNLHYHGLHIPPTGNADNIFLSIPSGTTQLYEFTLPQNHPAGTFYYHPHRHGLVAEQVFGGLGGVFIIRGELDEIPEIRAAQEAFLILKDFALDANGRVSQPWHMAQMSGREGPLVTVNGTVNPVLSMPSGGLLRLRLLNASSSRFYRLSLEDHSLYLIATDGGAIAEPIELRELLLTPGERAEVLIRGDREPGQYRLLDLPYDRGRMSMMGRGPMGPGMMGRGGRMGPGMMGRGRMGPGRMGSSEDQQPNALATLSYADRIVPLPLPRKLISVAALPKTQTVRRFNLNHSMVPGMGMIFLINGKSFDPQRVDTQVTLNTLEDWEITNTGVMDHPFHLHTNSFQVISRNGQPVPFRSWKDTVLVPVGETVRIRIPFQDFPGKTVYHCHIFDHEDLGMMGIIEMNA